MLVINFKGQLDLSLQLPRPRFRPGRSETEQGERLLYLNINSQGQLTLYNEVKATCSSGLPRRAGGDQAGEGEGQELR